MISDRSGPETITGTNTTSHGPRLDILKRVGWSIWAAPGGEAVLLWSAGLFLTAYATGLLQSEMACAQGEPIVRREGTLTYTTMQNNGGEKQVGGNYAALQFSNDASSAFYGCYKNRKADKRSGGAAVLAGDDLCEVQANGWDGATYNTSGTLNFAVDGPVGRNAVPTNFAVWLGTAKGSGISRNQLGFLIDQHSNAYFRNGNVGIGSIFGYNPPATYDEKRAPPFPLTIATQKPGGAFAAFQAGQSTGGAQINTDSGYSASYPIYGFWGDPTTGLGHSAAGTVNIIAAEREVARFNAKGTMQIAGTAESEAVRLRPIRYASLPACDAANAGTVAYVADIPKPVTAWRQRINAGGGKYSAFIACDGEGWHAF